MNSWEVNALDYHFKNDRTVKGSMASNLLVNQDDVIHDPIIYPGLYAPSGFDMMNILFRVASRPKPVVELGPVDSSCAIIMCDLQQPDCPIVYANEPCLELTGYSLPEMLGKNCRFLQAPDGKVRRRSRRDYVDKGIIKTMKRAVEANQEVAVEVTNFKRNGQMFVNLLAMIPVYWDSSEPRYSVGFLAEKT